MSEEREQPYIRQEAEGQALFSRLQADTLKEVQRMSGNVWTDYNAHDPGVTLADIANYGLTELDYKLGFPLADYLTNQDGVFNPEDYGLFLPQNVYTTTPVTTEDYRKLLLDRIPEIEEVTVEWNDEQCGYDIHFVSSPFEESHESILTDKVVEVYHAHRNLCERLNSATMKQQQKLEFQAELEMNPGCDATLLLARIYATVLHYLYGAAHICTKEERLTSQLSPEEWLEGSEDGTRIEIGTPHRTEYGLYKQLLKIEGVNTFSICYLMLNGKPQSDFSEGYGLYLPKEKSELKVRVRCGRTEMPIDFLRFQHLLHTLYYTQKRIQIKNSATNELKWELPQATYRNIFTQTPLAKDFPLCYRLSENREKPTSFEAYVKLYDRVIQKGLDEVKELPTVLSIKKNEKEKPANKKLMRLRSLYLDYLDRLYGVESQPDWLNEFGNYGETPEETLLRRMKFLRSVAELTRCRSKARDIMNPEFEFNVSVVKKWFCLLLGLDMSEDRSVGNVLPGYSFKLFDATKGKQWTLEAESILIEERMLDADKVMMIDISISWHDKDPRDDYSRLRQDLPIFNENKISGDLFRNGTRLDNYRIVDAGNDYFMLVFRNQERLGWTNLGRDKDKEKLNKLAVVLRRFLWRVNRECETLYVFEPIHWDKSRPFELDLVLPTWTYRFHSPRFREMCEELLRSIIPAHITYHIYWLDHQHISIFEGYYRGLMMALASNGMPTYQKVLYAKTKDFLENIKEADRTT